MILGILKKLFIFDEKYVTFNYKQLLSTSLFIYFLENVKVHRLETHAFYLSSTSGQKAIREFSLHQCNVAQSHDSSHVIPQLLKVDVCQSIIVNEVNNEHTGKLLFSSRQNFLRLLNLADTISTWIKQSCLLNHYQQTQCHYKISPTSRMSMQN